MEMSDDSNSSSPHDDRDVKVRFALRTGLNATGEQTTDPLPGAVGDKSEGVDDNSTASSLPAPDVHWKADDTPEFGLREDSTGDATTYNVVLIHGIRDPCKTVWLHDENGSNWVESELLKGREVKILEFRYDVSDTAAIYSEGIYAEAVGLLDGLVEIMRRSRQPRPIIFVTRDLGGIIAQKALLIASSKPHKYGIVVRLTYMMVFYNCPHRSCNILEAEDTMIRLLSLAGPPELPSLTALSTKARTLAKQVDMINHGAVDAMMWQHIPVVNIVSLPPQGGSENNAPSPDRPAYYLGQSSGMIQQPLENPIVTNTTHVELAQCKDDDSRMKFISTTIEEYINKTAGWDDATGQWRYFLSECPPVRPPFTQNIHEEASDDPFWSWFGERKEYQSWYDQNDMGTRILHVHASSLVDVWSDKIYHGIDKSWEGTTVRFQFDRNDIRFNNAHGMVSYLMIQLCRRLMFAGETNIVHDLVSFLSSSYAFSTIDLFQWILILRQYYQADSILYIVSCIDQCQDDVAGYLRQIQELGKHTELKFKLLITSDTNSDFMSQLETCPSIDLDSFVPQGQYSPNGLHQRNQNSLREFSALDSGTRALINETIDSYQSDYRSSGMLLAWLSSIQKPHGLGVDVIRILKNIAKPPSPASTYAFIQASLPESLKEKEKDFSVIVHTAFHPLSIDQIAWALVSNDTEEYLDEPHQRHLDVAAEIRQFSPGLYELKHGEVHPCYSHWGFEQNPAQDKVSSYHAMMTRICLRYLSIPQVQEEIENLNEAGPDDKTYLTYLGDNLTTYSVKFLPRHYHLAGEKRPKQELFNFFKNEKTRMAWQAVHSNLTCRLSRPVYSLPELVLPVVAQTGLVDLITMFMESKKNEKDFKKEVDFAIVEAARCGHKDIVSQLLKEVDAKSSALKTSISHAASHGSVEPLYELVRHCALITDFEWPEDILHRVSWLGLIVVARELLGAGVVPNPTKEPETFPGDSPLTLCMPGRHRKIAELLIQRCRADVSVKTSTGRLPLGQAARYCNPDTVALLLRCHAGDDSADLYSALDDACYSAAFTAIEELLANSRTIDWELVPEQLISSLTTATSNGYLQCVKAFTSREVNLNPSDSKTLPLHSAVQFKQLEVARLLLDHNADPNLTNELFKLPLLTAVDNEDVPMMKLLVEKGAKVEVEDRTETIMKTALCSASGKSNKELLDYLLMKGANVNHIAAGSRSPLFAATWNGHLDNVKALLEHGADINAVVSDPADWAPINAAYDNPDVLRALIEAGADINHRSADGTVLYLASRWGFETTVETLLKYGHDLDLDKEYIVQDDSENNRMTPLSTACKYSRVGIMRLLLEAGANAQHKSHHGSFPLGLCVEFAPEEQPDHALRLLLEYYPRINLEQRDDLGNTALHKIDSSTPLSIVKLLVNAGADLNSVNQKGYTALMVAAEAGNVEVCRYLLSKIAKLTGSSGVSPGLLHRAAVSGNLNLIQAVFEAGADINELDPQLGETPLYTHLRSSTPSILVVRYLVDTCKANVNLSNRDANFPIIQASKNGDIEIMRFLVEAGADVNVKDYAGRSPIHVLYDAGYNDIAVLVDHGADVEAKDKLGRTAVHYAAALGDENDVNQLLNLSEIDVNQTDDDGWTPLMWACLQRRTWNLDYVAEALISRGADIWARGKVEDEEWSPLKLARFHGGYGSWVLEQLEPTDKSKPRYAYGEGPQEYWDEEFHQSRRGFNWDGYTCDGCFCECFGVRRRCMESHPGGFDLCFRCYPHRDILHPGHERFEHLGERFGPESEGSEGSVGDDSGERTQSEPDERL